MNIPSFIRATWTRTPPTAPALKSPTAPALKSTRVKQAIDSRDTTIILSNDAPLVSVSDVQRQHLVALKWVEPLTGGRFILADIYSSPATGLWFLPDLGPAPLLQALASLSVKVRVVFRVKSKQPVVGEAASVLPPLFGAAHQVATVTVFQRYMCGERAIHGIMSGIDIHIAALNPARNIYVSAGYSFVQSLLSVEASKALPRRIFLGEEFPVTPNLASLMDAGTIPGSVDLVYTWVDGSDPTWVKRRAEALALLSDTSPADSAAASRYISRNELLYSIRSALTYFRDLGRIHIVTDRQCPDFLSEPNDRMRIVDHRHIFADIGHLPTFNSHAIESQLHRIPDLSERYIYVNDDVFFGRPVTPYLFFEEYGRSRYFVSRRVTIPDGAARPTDAAVDVAAKNARDLLLERFGIPVSRKFKHTPIALRKSIIEKMEADFPEAFSRTSAQKFRSLTDLAISGSLYFHYAALNGRAVEGEILYDYFDINAADFSKRLARIGSNVDRKRMDSFCINDVAPSEHTRRNAQILDAFLKSYFPLASPLEGPSKTGRSIVREAKPPQNEPDFEADGQPTSKEANWANANEQSINPP